MADVELLAVEDRPRMAARMVAVWRWHHMRRGDDLSITINLGEWPDGVPMEVKGCRVVEHETAAGGPGGMLALGRDGERWRFAYQLAIPELLGADMETLALVTIYGDVGDDQTRVWMSPSPITGEVPMWVKARQAPPATGSSPSAVDHG